MWRKLLIVCVFGIICGKSVEAVPARLEAGESIEHLVAASDSSQARPEHKRIALVIGNAQYPDKALGNPINDARAMSKTLTLLGFEIMRYENLSRQRMQDALREFNRRLDAGGVGLFYFSGHGLRVADQTLLLPIDADHHSPASVLNTSTDLRTVLDHMSGSRPGKLNLVILDTCLNNPFTTALNTNSHSAADTFAAPEQTLIAYATAPGTFAADGARHGLYTAALLKAMAIPGQDIGQVFQRAATAVRRASNQQQTPWVASSLAGELRLVTAAQAIKLAAGMAATQDELVLAQQSRGVIPKDSAEQYELTFWESIKDSSHVSDYEAYLQSYPNGRFAALARARIERLRKAEATPGTAPAVKAPQERPRPASPATKAPPEKPRPAPAAKTAPQPAPPASVASPTPEQPAPEKPAGPVNVSEVKDCPTCPDLIVLPGGAFTMGSNSSDPSEKPAHKISINAPIAIGKYEVTVEQWEACANAGACPRIASDASRPKNLPMRDVSWDDAQQYVKWLSKISGKSYRLPTEAEWEYAARGGTATRYWWGDQMRTGKANCKDCGEPWRQDGPVSVGSFAANPYGLHDMNGSVWEWVSDCWHNSYKGAPADGRSWEEQNCRVRVIRGGSWREGASYMPASTRFKYDASVRHSQNGFRVARDNK